MADLSTLAAYAEIFGAVTVIGGLLFAVIQIRALKEQRRDMASIAILNSFTSDPELAERIRIIERLPDEGLVEYLEAHPELQKTIDGVYALCEALGYMVYERSLRLDQVNTLVGGAVVAMWDKLAPLAHHERAVTGRGGAFEWMEFLAHHLQRQGDPRAGGNALQRHADWRP